MENLGRRLQQRTQPGPAPNSQSPNHNPRIHPPPPGIDLKQYDDDGRFGYGEGKQIKLQFRIAKSAGFHLLECPLSHDQTVLELPDAYEITATVVESARLEWWLRGFGGAVTGVCREPVPVG